MSDLQSIPDSRAEAIREAALALNAGHLVAFPTETVYGLGADARNSNAVKRIYEVKGRPMDHPLIVHISSINQLDKWAIEIPEYAIKLARKFWPGQMTLILKRSEIVGNFITGGQDTVGLRVPNDPNALALIKEFEKISDSAIAAPSANRFGQVSPTSSEDVQEELGDYLSADDLVLDGGSSTIGIESTIINCTEEYPTILRSGFVTKEKIKSELGARAIEHSARTDIKFSGSFDSHYAPKCKIIITNVIIDGAGFFAMAMIKTPPGMKRLGSPANIDEFARTLYASFRKADHLGITKLVVIQPEGDGMAVALRERLSKAANGR